jgi:hypothetical protein
LPVGGHLDARPQMALILVLYPATMRFPNNIQLLASRLRLLWSTARQAVNQFLTVINLRKADIRTNTRTSAIDPKSPQQRRLTGC